MKRKPGHNYAVISHTSVVSTHTSIWPAKARAKAIVGAQVAMWDIESKSWRTDLENIGPYRIK